jgi:DinB family protein
MAAPHPINQTLLHLLENQENRTRCAFEGLTHEAYSRAPGFPAGDCHSIQQIGEHLIELRGFQLMLLGSQRAKDMPEGSAASLDDLITKLEKATALVRQAIHEHDPNDWHAQPTEPRDDGPWNDQPTLIRVIRPINDFTNHLGAIRALRRVFNNPAEQTQ